MDRLPPQPFQLPAGLALLAAGLIGTAQVWAQSSASYQIPRQSIDAGGGRSSSASHELVSSIGQPEAAAAMSSASYTLRGGLLKTAESAAPIDPIFANGFEP